MLSTFLTKKFVVRGPPSSTSGAAGASPSPLLLLQFGMRGMRTPRLLCETRRPNVIPLAAATTLLQVFFFLFSFSFSFVAASCASVPLPACVCVCWDSGGGGRRSLPACSQQMMLGVVPGALASAPESLDAPIEDPSAVRVNAGVREPETPRDRIFVSLRQTD